MLYHPACTSPSQGSKSLTLNFLFDFAIVAGDEFWNKSSASPYPYFLKGCQLTLMYCKKSAIRMDRVLGYKSDLCYKASTYLFCLQPLVRNWHVSDLSLLLCTFMGQGTS